VARPRKDSPELDARTRIIEAFWTLIEKNDFASLSVGQVVAEAGCNRGTFYYYFRDLDELASTAIDLLLQNDALIANALWCVSNEGDAAAFEGTEVRRMLHRVVVAIGAGCARSVNQTMYVNALACWRRLACLDGGDLEPDARFAIKFMLFGVMSYIVTVGMAEEGIDGFERDDPGTDARAYLRDVATLTAQTVAKVQGLDPDTLLERGRRVFAEMQEEKDGASC